MRPWTGTFVWNFSRNDSGIVRAVRSAEMGTETRTSPAYTRYMSVHIKGVNLRTRSERSSSSSSSTEKGNTTGRSRGGGRIIKYFNIPCRGDPNALALASRGCNAVDSNTLRLGPLGELLVLGARIAHVANHCSGGSMRTKSRRRWCLSRSGTYAV